YHRRICVGTGPHDPRSNATGYDRRSLGKFSSILNFTAPPKAEDLLRAPTPPHTPAPHRCAPAVVMGSFSRFLPGRHFPPGYRGCWSRKLVSLWRRVGHGKRRGRSQGIVASRSRVGSPLAIIISH